MMDNKLPVSAVVFTKNEALNIAECLQSLIWFDEILVIDSCSDDNTRTIAAEMGAKIVNFVWDGQYPKKRQWSLENVKYRNPWIFFVDADERMTDALVIELRNFLTLDSHKFDAGSIPIDYYFAGKRLKHGQRPRKTVLLRLGVVEFPKVDDLAAEGMGELEGHYQPVVSGKVRNFSARIKHNDNDPISTWMVRHVNYAKWEAFLLVHEGVKKKVDNSKGWVASIFHKLPFRPLGFFAYSYFLKLGFLDGKAGFDYAFAKSWYYWLSKVIAKENLRDGE
jgi:glycosyltransferase involved in cell wall biosynthesis